MSTTPSHDERDAGQGRRPFVESTLPPVVPENEEPNSLPPVVPDDEEPNSLPPVVPDDEEPNSLPPVVPDDDEPNSLPPVVPENDEPNSLPPVVPDDDEPNSPPPVVPEDDEPEQPDTVPPVEPQDEAPSEPSVAPEADEPARADQGTDSSPDGPRAEAASVPDDETVAAPGRTDPAEPSGWAVLGRALKPRSTRAQLVAGVLCAVLGFALVAQVRQSGEADLGGMRQDDLVRILDETTNRGDALAREAADLARERDDLLSGSDRRQAALDALRRSAETQGILTGRLPAQGPGVVVLLTEPDGYIKPITMLNMLEEMRNAGAEAIQLNDQRVTASSAFTGSGGAVVLDGVELTAPYRWTVIGDPDIIAPALQIPGGAMAQVRNNGGKGTVERADLVEVDAIRVVPEPVYATPVPPQGD
ncbi:DUF881 domain-containing protein [Cellulomonas humilata]|uniref:DUF881 domain-containing protein n=1 Tax=Cellulomonas humilata TaxID=144055 RepID=A0A7Y6A267_9CELL|nr:DUF881 domain-containing protein [Cellulomonas humilata]NUU17718.1 DUF881 domain-containing protein [Cellulomonas humilata]